MKKLFGFILILTMSCALWFAAAPPIGASANAATVTECVFEHEDDDYNLYDEAYFTVPAGVNSINVYFGGYGDFDILLYINDTYRDFWSGRFEGFNENYDNDFGDYGSYWFDTYSVTAGDVLYFDYFYEWSFYCFIEYIVEEPIREALTFDLNGRVLTVSGFTIGEKFSFYLNKYVSRTPGGGYTGVTAGTASTPIMTADSASMIFELPIDLTANYYINMFFYGENARAAILSFDLSGTVIPENISLSVVDGIATVGNLVVGETVKITYYSVTYSLGTYSYEIFGATQFVAAAETMTFDLSVLFAGSASGFIYGLSFSVIGESPRESVRALYIHGELDYGNTDKKTGGGWFDGDFFGFLGNNPGYGILAAVIVGLILLAIFRKK